MNILIIEDEPIVAAVIEKLLKNISFVNLVQTVHSFDEGFEKSNSDVFDIVLIDIMLGHKDYDGLRLCEIFRKNNAEIPLIIITAYDSLSYLEKAFAAGANDYITKPFHHKEVELRVRRWLMLTHKIIVKREINYGALSFKPNEGCFFYQKKI